MTEPYLPANGIEGIDFQVAWCARCACDQLDLSTGEGAQCPILDDSYSGKQPPEWVQRAGERPVCTAFVEDVGQGAVDPYAVQKDQARYDALPRDPVTGRPVIA